MNINYKSITFKVLKLIFIVFICYIIFSFLLFIVFLFIRGKDLNRFDYNSSKKVAIEFLNDNKEELESMTKEIYTSKSFKENPYKNIISVNYVESAQDLYDKEHIEFYMDSQGMLGGQYYGLIYSLDSNFNDNKVIKIYDQFKETGNGNNIYIREKISDNWYFFYNDYDGKVNLKTIDSKKEY